MGKIFLLLLTLTGCSVSASAQMQTDTFAFSFEGKRYSGLIDQPEKKPATAMVVIIPGSGKTDIVAGQWFLRMRSRFTEQGFSCLVWDKAGCGNSEGKFDFDPTVQDAAREVIAAITEAKAKNIPGSETIGLWGISRAGWICPLVIEQHPIAFWISVSGTDDKETFGYLLKKNLVIEGRTEAQAEMLVNEWMKGAEIARSGGTFEENLKATENLRKDSLYMYFNGNDVPTREGYLRWQNTFATGENIVDEETGLKIYVPDFDKLLNKINCPVLALFGEKDSQIDWQRTIAFYKKTIGAKPHANLTIKTFPEGNHNIQKCTTGGFREKLTSYKPCDGYYETMASWLKEQGFGN